MEVVGTGVDDPAPLPHVGGRSDPGRLDGLAGDELGREPSEQELASAAGLVPGGVAQVLGMVREPLSLDAPRGPESESSLGESVADRAAVSPTEHAARRERADRLHHLLLGLTSREQQFVTVALDLAEAERAKQTYPRYVPD